METATIDTELSTLPIDHPLRNTPMVGFQSRTYEYRGKGEWKWSLWKTVMKAWPIADKTYNELGKVWISAPKSEWRQPRPKKII